MDYTGKIRIIGVIALVFAFSSVWAQSGPGGVGNISNNGLWLNTDQLDMNDGDQILVWPDASGNGNSAMPDQPIKAPLYSTTNSINGRPTIAFDGADDELIVPDADILDDSEGLTYFVVLRPKNVDGEPRGILAKRKDFSDTLQYSYSLFFYSGQKLYADINSTDDRFSTPNSINNDEVILLVFHFDGSQVQSERVRIFSGEELLTVASESTTGIKNSDSDLVLGALNANYGHYLQADYAEVIQYNYALNEAERIIVNNYLASKYDIALTSNNYYNSLGTHEYEVTGIGRVDAGNVHDEARGSSFITIYNPDNLEDGEFMLWGHDNLQPFAYEVDDVPAGSDARFERSWLVNETGDVGAVDIHIDLRDYGIILPEDLQLLISSDGSGTFANAKIITGAIDLGGGQYRFDGVSDLQDGVFFTLATANLGSTSLPVEWMGIEAKPGLGEVEINWTVASELNNMAFVVERSVNARDYEFVDQVASIGDHQTVFTYSAMDRFPLNQRSYYRVRQIDMDGTESLSPVVEVFIQDGGFSAPVEVYPNPVGINQSVTITIPGGGVGSTSIELMDIHGRTVSQKSLNGGSEITQVIDYKIDAPLPGFYFLRVQQGNTMETIELIVQ